MKAPKPPTAMLKELRRQQTQKVNDAVRKHQEALERINANGKISNRAKLLCTTAAVGAFTVAAFYVVDRFIWS